MREQPAHRREGSDGGHRSTSDLSEPMVVTDRSRSSHRGDWSGVEVQNGKSRDAAPHVGEDVPAIRGRDAFCGAENGRTRNHDDDEQGRRRRMNSGREFAVQDRRNVGLAILRPDSSQPVLRRERLASRRVRACVRACVPRWGRKLCDCPPHSLPIGMHVSHMTCPVPSEESSAVPRSVSSEYSIHVPHISSLRARLHWRPAFPVSVIDPSSPGVPT